MTPSDQSDLMRYERLEAWANEYEAALLAVRTQATLTHSGWLISNDTFEWVRRALEDGPGD